MKHLESRRKGAIARLDAQLNSRVKNTSEGVLPLTDKDITRITKELETLKARLR
mgnify:FL=1